MNKIYSNVFDALEDDRSVAENLKIKSHLLIMIEMHITKNKMTQRKAAELMGVSQPRISDLMRGKIERFTIDMLVNMLAKAGIRLNFSPETIEQSNGYDLCDESFYDAGFTVISAPVYNETHIVNSTSVSSNVKWDA